MLHKNFISKFLLVYLSLVVFNLDVHASSLSDKYFYAKKNYATAIISSNTKKEIKYLKQIILYGNKLKKNVSKYKKELNKFGYKSTYIKKKSINNNLYPKNTSKYKNNRYSITNVKVQDNSIIIDFKHNISKSYVKYKEYKKSSYYYDEFDIKGNFKDAKPLKLSIDGINKIMIYQYRTKTLRISIRNKYNTKAIYIINKKRLIIKLYPKKIYNNKKSTIKIINNKYNQNKTINKTIVIDAGHGGKDSGAIGPFRRYEKYVVLNISKYLYKELKQKGFKVYLTRNKDKYLKLTQRTKFANKLNADIFISIHANSVAKSNASKVKGIETYFLSPARSSRAKRVAAKENSSDIKSIGYSSKNIVLELLNRSKITSSQKLAIDVQSHMLYNLRKYYGKSILDKGVREGPFWILVGAQMPAILIEVGYVSHPSESKRLYSSSYQKKIAHGIANGVLSYFSKN